MKFGASVAKALLTGAKSTEIFTGSGNHVVVEGEINAALLVCEEVSEKMKIGGHQRYCNQEYSDVGEGGAIDLTFDLGGGLVAVIQDRSLPGHVEIGLYCHCCLRSAEMLD